MSNVRSFLNWRDGYFAINREERNLAAILYHLLLLEDYLGSFLASISCPFSVEPTELGIYFEYSYLRDLWYNIGDGEDGNEVKRRLIYTFLRPGSLPELERMSVFEFNSHFGAVPRASRKTIQSPGNWSMDRFRERFTDSDEFLRVCKFKWSFNTKPDIVIHTSHDTAVCIEAKYESGEGSYPGKPSEVEEFQRRSIRPVSQTALQKYLMEDLLGIETQFVFLVQKPTAKSETHTDMLWKDAFSSLKLGSAPFFIREWIRRL